MFFLVYPYWLRFIEHRLLEICKCFRRGVSDTVGVTVIVTGVERNWRFYSFFIRRILYVACLTRLGQFGGEKIPLFEFRNSHYVTT